MSSLSKVWALLLWPSPLCAFCLLRGLSLHYFPLLWSLTLLLRHSRPFKIINRLNLYWLNFWIAAPFTWIHILNLLHYLINFSLNIVYRNLIMIMIIILSTPWIIDLSILFNDLWCIKPFLPHIFYYWIIIDLSIILLTIIFSQKFRSA